MERELFQTRLTASAREAQMGAKCLIHEPMGDISYANHNTLLLSLKDSWSPYNAKYI
jgi:hypothetical protein